MKRFFAYLLWSYLCLIWKFIKEYIDQRNEKRKFFVDPEIVYAIVCQVLESQDELLIELTSQKIYIQSLKV